MNPSQGPPPAPSVYNPSSQYQQSQSYGGDPNQQAVAAQQYHPSFYPQVTSTAAPGMAGYPSASSGYNMPPVPPQPQQQQQSYYSQSNVNIQQPRPARGQFPAPPGIDASSQAQASSMYPYYPPALQQMYGAPHMQQPYYPQQQQQSQQQQAVQGAQQQQAAPNNNGGAAPAPRNSSAFDSPVFIPPALQGGSHTQVSKDHIVDNNINNHARNSSPQTTQQRQVPPPMPTYAAFAPLPPYMPHPSAGAGVGVAPPPMMGMNPGQFYSMDRKAKKNAQSRARAAKLRERIELLQTRPPESLNEEEKQILETYEERRRRKNERSRERAIEKKIEIETILNKPDKKRSKNEEETLVIALNAKKRKNEGDRLRRERIKMSQLAAGANVGRSGRGRPKKPLDPNAYATAMGSGNQYMPMQNNDLYTAAAGANPVPYSVAAGYPAANDYPHAPTALYAPPPASSPHSNTAYPVQQTQHEDGSVSINIFGGDAAQAQQRDGADKNASTSTSI